MNQKRQSQRNDDDVEVETIDVSSLPELSCRNDSHVLSIDLSERRVFCSVCGRGIRIRPQDILEKEGKLFIKEGFGVPIDIALKIV
jgi:hypothetical protein